MRLDRQKGMTMWGVAGLLAVGAFFALLFLKLSPPYMENMKVKSVLERVKAQAGSMSQEALVEAVQKRFDIEDVREVDAKSALKVEVRGTQKVIRIAYERRIPIAYNVSALLTFDNSVQVNRVE